MSFNLWPVLIPTPGEAQAHSSLRLTKKSTDWVCHADFMILHGFSKMIRSQGESLLARWKMDLWTFGMPKNFLMEKGDYAAMLNRI